MYSTQVKIELNKLKQNISIIKQQTNDAKIMAIVKANAYGHGAVEIAQAALEENVSMFGVANVIEGMELRNAGIDSPILILGASSKEQTIIAIKNNISLTVCSEYTLNWVIEASIELNQKVNIHVKIDTGMGRIGYTNVQEFIKLYKKIKQPDLIEIEGVFTHMADGDNDKYTRMQIQRFEQAVIQIEKELKVKPKFIHGENTVAIQRNYSINQQNIVRAGIGMYGYEDRTENGLLQPILSWTTQIRHLKQSKKNDLLGYGCTYKCKENIMVATLPVGYGDGYPRLLSNKGCVIIKGEKCDILGRVCMDQIMVDVSGVNDVQVGDTATLIGCDGEAHISAEDIANWAQTISYEVLTGITPRVHREYKND